MSNKTNLIFCDQSQELGLNSASKSFLQQFPDGF
jgi:hypothetical protein